MAVSPESRRELVTGPFSSAILTRSLSLCGSISTTHFHRLTSKNLDLRFGYVPHVAHTPSSVQDVPIAKGMFAETEVIPHAPKDWRLFRTATPPIWRSFLMTRKLILASLFAAIALQQTGCCLLRNVAYRIRNCHRCYPGFAGYGGHGGVPVEAGGGPGYDVGGFAAPSPVFGGAAPGCSSCYKAGGIVSPIPGMATSNVQGAGPEMHGQFSGVPVFAAPPIASAGPVIYPSSEIKPGAK